MLVRNRTAISSISKYNRITSTSLFLFVVFWSLLRKKGKHLPHQVIFSYLHLSSVFWRSANTVSACESHLTRFVWVNLMLVVSAGCLSSLIWEVRYFEKFVGNVFTASEIHICCINLLNKEQYVEDDHSGIYWVCRRDVLLRMEI